MWTHCGHTRKEDPALMVLLGFAKVMSRGDPGPPLLSRRPSQGPSHQFADPVQDQIDDLLADGVMASGVVIGCVLLPGDQLLRVEELPVGPRAHFICREDSVPETLRTVADSPGWPGPEKPSILQARAAPRRPAASASHRKGLRVIHVPYLPFMAPGRSSQPGEQMPVWPVPKGGGVLTPHRRFCACMFRSHPQLHPGCC